MRMEAVDASYMDGNSDTNNPKDVGGGGGGEGTGDSNLCHRQLVSPSWTSLVARQ